MKSIFKLRKLFVYLALMLSTLNFGNKTYAATGKFVAAYIYMDWVGKAPGDYLYRVYVTLYQKCGNGISDFNATENVCWSSGTCYPGLGWKTMAIKPIDTNIVDGYCPTISANNSCRSAGSTYPAYMSITYSDTLRLAGSCNDWIINWLPRSGDTYSGSLSSINTPTSYGVMDARIFNFNNKVDPLATPPYDYRTRSTPRFTAQPNFYFCPNVVDYFPTNPMTPSSGDQLSVSNYNTYYYNAGASCATARLSLTTWYKPGYGVGSPFGFSTYPWTVDPVTGMCTVIPQNTGEYLFNTVITSSDPATANLLCQVYGWTQVNVDNNNCGPTPLPTIDSLANNVTGGVQTGDTISVCAGSLLQFTVESKKTGSSIHMTYNNNSAPASTITVSGEGTGDAVASFSWKPLGTDVGDHLITIEAEDSTCSGGQLVMSKVYMNVIIHVNYSVVASSNNNYCPAVSPGDKSSLPDTLHVSGPPGAVFTWTDLNTPATISCFTCTDPTSTPATDPALYTVYSSIPTGCKDTDTVVIHVYPPDKFDAGVGGTICLNQSFQLNATVQPGDTYFWFPPTDLSCTTCLSPLCRPTSFGDDSVYFHVTDVQKCNYLDTVIVKAVNEAPKIIVYASPDSVCPEGSSQLHCFILGAGGKKCGLTTSIPSPLLPPASLTGDIDAGLATHPSGPPAYGGDPNIFETYYYGGQRQQIIYTAKELLLGGVSPGYLTSIAYHFTGHMNCADSFLQFKISMACVKDSQFYPNPAYPSRTCFIAMPGAVTVYPPKNILPTDAALNNGWYTFNFSNSFYWDGISNIVVDMCYGKPYTSSGFTNDPLDLVNTNTPRTAYTNDDYYTSTYAGGSYPYSACGANCGSSYHYYYIFSASSRPQTKFVERIDTGLYVYSWTPSTWLDCTGCPNPTVNGITKKTTYNIKVYAKSSPACYSIDSAHVAVDTTNHVVAIPENIVMCRPGYQQLNAQGYGPGPIGNMNCGTASPLTCPTLTQRIIGGAPSSGNNYITPFNDESGTSEMLFNRHELLGSNMTAGTIRAVDFYITGANYSGSYNFQNMQIWLLCTDKTEFASPTDTVSHSSMTLVYSATSTMIPSSPGVLQFVLNTPYSWDTTKNLLMAICYGSPSSSYPWAYTTFTTTNFRSFVAQPAFATNACGHQSAGGWYTPTIYSMRPQVTFEYCGAPSYNFFSYTWKPGTYISDSTVQSPIAYVNNPGKVTTYSVYTRGRNMCLVHDSVNIYQPSHSYSIYPKDTAFCEGGSAKLSVKGASKTTTYQWFQNGFQTASSLSCNTCANPTATPHNTGSTIVDTFTYQLVLTDSVGCSDTVFSRMEVKPIPIVKTLTHDTTINYNGSVQLIATGATVYTWTPTGSLNNPNIVNPIASPKEPTTYTVRGLSVNGCAASDTVHVNINYHGKVFVPTAFTPNGDGKNDIFRVANVTFEKILEFHVFNRWGQELYYSTDNGGWDGMWHNEPQDIGTYQFLIRVASPDGTIQTFKGDVTLLR